MPNRQPQDDPARGVQPSHLTAPIAAIEAAATEFFDELATTTGRLYAGDRVHFLQAIRAAVDGAVNRSWDASDHTFEADPHRPEKSARGTSTVPATAPRER